MKTLKIIAKVISILLQIIAVPILTVGTVIYFISIFITDPKTTFNVVKEALKKLKNG